MEGRVSLPVESSKPFPKNNRDGPALSKENGKRLPRSIFTQTNRRIMKRTANAEWQGNLQEGTGKVSAQSGAIQDQPYSFKTRFTDDSGQKGTNPEELIAAAHAACYSMALSNMLAERDFTPDSVATQAQLTLTMDGGPKITAIHLRTQAQVPQITDEQFQAVAEDAKEGCPVSQVLKADITLEAALTV